MDNVIIPYRIHPTGIDKRVKPFIPDNVYGDEDKTTLRIPVSTSIVGCCNAVLDIYLKDTEWDIDIYAKQSAYVPTEAQCWEASISDEH